MNGRERQMRVLGYCILMLSGILFLAGCPASQVPSKVEMAVAAQYGLAYAPVAIMQEKDFLLQAMRDEYGDERELSVKWVKLANTTSIRDAMVAGEVEVAFVGIPPFLIGVDQGVPWRMLSALSECPVELLTRNPDIRSLEDLVGAGRIALPQPGSIQHMLLAMAAERQWGDASLFDRQLISMKHPDGLQALLSGNDIAAHFTAPPYNFMATGQEQVRVLLTGEEATGEAFSFIVGIALPAFYEDDVRRNVFLRALDTSMAFLRDNREESVQILAGLFGLTEEQTDDYLYHRGISYEREIRGTQIFLDFMLETGYLEKTHAYETLIWPPSHEE